MLAYRMALLADLDAAAQAHDLAVPAGWHRREYISGGLTLGGMASADMHGGFSIDNLRGAEAIVADGRILPASEDEKFEFLALKDWRRSRHCRQCRLDEAVSEVGEDDTAFGGGLPPHYSVNLAASCTTPEELPAEREWVPSLFDALRPHRSELS